MLLLHCTSGTVLNPMAHFSPDMQARFFGGPVSESKLERHRVRLAEYLGTHVDVLVQNHECAREVIHTLLEKFPTQPQKAPDGS